MMEILHFFLEFRSLCVIVIPHTPKNKSVCEIMTFATLMKYKYILVEVRRFNTIIAKLETYSHGVRLVILD